MACERPPRPLPQRWLRDIYLRSRPPLLCEEGNKTKIKKVPFPFLKSSYRAGIVVESATVRDRITANAAFDRHPCLQRARGSACAAVRTSAGDERPSELRNHHRGRRQHGWNLRGTSTFGG